MKEEKVIKLRDIWEKQEVEVEVTEYVLEDGSRFEDKKNAEYVENKLATDVLWKSMPQLDDGWQDWFLARGREDVNKLVASVTKGYFWKLDTHYDNEPKKFPCLFHLEIIDPNRELFIIRYLYVEDIMKLMNLNNTLDTME